MKIKISFQLLILLLIFSGKISAQLDNLSNMSAKWVRTNVRNASLDGTDIVNYNPAGLARLNDGIYFSLSNQTLFRKPEHSFNIGAGEQSYKQEKADPILPMFYAAYKKDKWAISSGVYISGGGASVNYPQGSINTTLLGYSYLPMINASYGTDYSSLTNQSLKASSYYLTVPLNFSYAVNEKIALSIGGRYVKCINRTKAGITFTGASVAPDYPVNVDYKSNANGFGGVFGVNYSPCEKLNIAIHYETRVKLDFEADDNKGNISIEEDGSKSRRDLPAVINTGLTYKFTEKISFGADFNYYFQKNANWGTITDPASGEIKKASEVAGNCYTTNLGFTYQWNEKLQLSAGCSYTTFLFDDKELYYTKMGLYEALKNNNLNIGIGAGYNITKKVQIDLGFGRTFWKDYTIKSINAGGVDVNTSDKSYVIAIGVDIAI